MMCESRRVSLRGQSARVPILSGLGVLMASQRGAD